MDGGMDGFGEVRMSKRLVYSSAYAVCGVQHDCWMIVTHNDKVPNQVKSESTIQYLSVRCRR